MSATASATFREEAIIDTWPEALDLLRANHAETGILSKDDFDPDAERYFLMERAGITKLFTMRDAGSKLVGYGSLILAKSHLHYPKKSYAHQDALYVVPEHRGRIAVEFIEFQDERLKEEGVNIVDRNTVSRGPAFARSLTRLGYAEAEVKFIRVLQ